MQCLTEEHATAVFEQFDRATWVSGGDPCGGRVTGQSSRLLETVFAVTAGQRWPDALQDEIDGVLISLQRLCCVCLQHPRPKAVLNRAGGQPRGFGQYLGGPP